MAKKRVSSLEKPAFMHFLHEHGVSESDPDIVEYINNLPQLLDAGVIVRRNNVIDFILKHRGHMVNALALGRDSIWNRKFEDEFTYFIELTSTQWMEFNENCAVFFNNPLYINHPGFKILRYQDTKICGGANAGVAFLHYMMSIQSNGSIHVGSIDILRLQNHHKLSGIELVNVLFHIPTQVSLESILQCGSLTEDHFLRLHFEYPYSLPSNSHQKRRNDEKAADMMSLLRSQPAILRNFRYEDKFLKYSYRSISHTGIYLPDAPLHSMLVVGARWDDTTGAYYFLMQNWHENKQFVEITGEYLAHNGVAFWFLLPDTKIVAKHSLSYTYEEAIETFAEQEVWDLGFGDGSKDY